jgi:hypothetical protein
MLSSLLTLPIPPSKKLILIFPVNLLFTRFSINVNNHFNYETSFCVGSADQSNSLRTYAIQRTPVIKKYTDYFHPGITSQNSKNPFQRVSPVVDLESALTQIDEV